MNTFSVCHAGTGLFTGVVITLDQSLSAEALALAASLNTPAGHVAVPGCHDHLSRRLDVETGEVVDWQPPAPPADEFTSWAWDADARRWLPAPTNAAIARDARAERDRRLTACDWVVMRAQDLGQPVPTAWSAYRQALRDITQQAGFPQAIEWPTAPI